MGSRIYLKSNNIIKKRYNYSRKKTKQGWIEFTKSKNARLLPKILNGKLINEKYDSNFQSNFWDLTFLRNLKWDEIMTECIHSYASQNHEISNNSLMAKKMCQLFLKKIKKLK